MRIGILGSGQMARVLGAGWSAAGHDILVGARSVDKAAKLADDLGGGVRGGTLRDAAEFGEALLLAVPASAVADVLGAAGAAERVLEGRVVVDCTNAFAPDEAAKSGTMAFVLSEAALAERVAELATGARVVKALNLCAAEVWESKTRILDGRRLAVPLCGDDPMAVEQVAGLVSDLGLAPVNAGGLGRARYLEAMSAFVVSLWFAGEDPRAMIPPLESAFAVPDAEDEEG